MNRFAKLIRGFSLIELMVVIAIVAVLASVAIPFYKQYVNNVKLAELWRKINTYADIAKMHYVSQGYWPTLPFQVNPSTYGSILDPTAENLQVIIANINAMNLWFPHPETFSEVMNQTADPDISQIQSLSGRVNHTCNYWYGWVGLNKDALGAGYTTGDFLEFEFGANIETGEIKSYCALRLSGGTSHVYPSFLKCDYPTWEALESATGNNSCP